MNKIKIFAIAVLSVVALAFVSCGGGKQDVTYKGRLGTIEFVGDTVTMSGSEGIFKGTYTGNAAKNGSIGLNFTEESKDDGQSFHEYVTVYKATVENGVLTIDLDGRPYNFTVVK